MKRLFAAVLAVGLLVTVSRAETFQIDPAHSSVTFTIHHLVGRVAGHFDQFSGSFNYDEKETKSWSAQADIETASINTANPKRDDHLRSADFFDVSKYPKMTFKSTGVSNVTGKTAKLMGNLTLHGVTKPVVLDLEIGGVTKDPFGSGKRAGATAMTKINRKDYGIIWNKALEAGGMMVGDEVDIVLNVEGISK
jgi:polyisoprenoid-binding protein YceI